MTVKKYSRDEMREEVASVIGAEGLERAAQIQDQGRVYFNAMMAYEARADKAAPLSDFLGVEGANALEKFTASAITNAPRTIPTVTEFEGGRERGYDLFSLLMKQRIVLLEGQVEDVMASIAVASLLYLNSAASGKPDEPIVVHVNSPGGSVLAGMAIYDTMRSIAPQITTVGMGMQASMGSILLAAGDYRKMSRSSMLMIHQISSGAQGQHTDTAISESLSGRLHEQLKDVYVRHIGLKHEFWDLALERDTYLTADQAKKMGFIDEIILGDRKKTAFEQDSIRGEFQKARDSLVPKTADEIVMMLNNGSARQGEAAKIRPELVTALSQFPQFWTPPLLAQRTTAALAAENPGLVAAIAAVDVLRAEAGQEGLLTTIARNNLTKKDYTIEGLAKQALKGVEHLENVLAGRVTSPASNENTAPKAKKTVGKGPTN